ncbi:MAG: 3-dehydroquinate synthase [Paludibacteraceae bacterium]|nr:3-dehydroquinate synthase [Paludibacteraceae bacterium]
MICENLHSSLASLLASYDRQQVVVVRDANVTFESPYPTLVITADEAHKTIETVAQIWDFLLANEVTRRGVIVCVGGGVLTDIGGFAAATYKRGIDYINIPTTLLAMVDASSGGKTGVNYQGLKNCIGCFAPPVETLIDVAWLRTLPAQEMLSGFGEMVKTGLIEPSAVSYQPSERLWDRLLQYDLERMDIAELKPLIAECIKVKEQIVTADPKEEGLRKVLNLGHTFGHALEESRQPSAVSHQMPHGYAVVYGLIAELYLSVVKLGCPKEPLQQLTQLMLHYYGRPQCNCKNRERLISLMQRDKKNERATEINCTLLQQVGSPVINQVVTPAEADEALEYLFSL